MEKGENARKNAVEKPKKRSLSTNVCSFHKESESYPQAQADGYSLDICIKGERRKKINRKQPCVFGFFRYQK